jgi:hypothetical protein
MLNFNVVTNDLYVDANGYLGYYQKLKEQNQYRDIKIEEQAGLVNDIAQY